MLIHKISKYFFFGFVLCIISASKSSIAIFIFTTFLLICFLFYKGLLSKWVVGALVLGMALGFLRYQMNDTSSGLLPNFPEKIEAELIDEPDVRENHTKLLVKTDELRILIITGKYPIYEYGDRLLIEGEVRSVENFSDFDYRAYLAKDEIYYEMYRPDITILDRGGGSFIKRDLFRFKNWFLERIARFIPEPESALAGGILIGAKASLGAELLEDFRRVGLVHIVVLSGFNVLIVAQFFAYVFKFLPRRISFTLAIVSIVLFAILTGGGPPTVRASIMASIAMIARQTGRTYSASTALIVAGFLMVFVNPKVLVFDVGFQLSFLATLGIIYLAPIIESKLQFISKKFGLRELITMTLSAQLAVTPWILYTIGSFSVLALPVNIIALPVIPLAMLFSFLGGFLGPPLSWIAYILLHYIVAVTESTARIPFASVDSVKLPLWLTGLIYLLILGLWYYINQHVVTSGKSELLESKDNIHVEKNIN